jgi:hypothetical protein
MYKSNSGLLLGLPQPFNKVQLPAVKHMPELFWIGYPHLAAAAMLAASTADTDCLGSQQLAHMQVVASLHDRAAKDTLA